MKKKSTKAKKTKSYRIYGIYDFKKNRLVQVSLKREDVEMEYEFEGYELPQFDIISFKIDIA